MTARYAHTNIIAQDWAALAAFYTEVFGCVLVPPQRDQSGDWLSRGSAVPDAHLQGVHLRLPGHGDEGPTLEIYSYKQMLDKPPAAANRKGLGHLAFEVDNVPNYLARLEAAGGSALGEVVVRPVEGVGVLTFVYARDPEDNIVELQSWDRGQVL